MRKESKETTKSKAKQESVAKKRLNIQEVNESVFSSFYVFYDSSMNGKSIRPLLFMNRTEIVGKESGRRKDVKENRKEKSERVKEEEENRKINNESPSERGKGRKGRKNAKITSLKGP